MLHFNPDLSDANQLDKEYSEEVGNIMAHFWEGAKSVAGRVQFVLFQDDEKWFYAHWW
jgi:hypothetical protein